MMCTASHPLEEEGIVASGNPTFTLHAIMTYTRRVIGLEVKRLQSGTHRPDLSSSLSSAANYAGLQEAVTSQAESAFASLSVDTLTPAEVLQTALPPRALLLLELGTAPALDQAELLSYCTSLRAAGFAVGIADYRGEAVWKRSLPLLSHIRVRYTGALLPQQKELLRSPLRRQLSFIADGVETDKQLKDAIDAGFQLFQGEFAHRTLRLHWPIAEFKSRALLLQKACTTGELSVEAVQDFTNIGSLDLRLRALLKSEGTAPRVLNSPELLLAELGEERLRQCMQICLVHDMTGQASFTFTSRLFHVARFHELMRASALARPSPSARFEGLLLGAIISVERNESGHGLQTSTMLKQC